MSKEISGSGSSRGRSQRKGIGDWFVVEGGGGLLHSGTRLCLSWTVQPLKATAERETCG